MQQEQADALDGVYRAFEPYARPEWIEACACCWGGEPVEETGRFGGRGTVRVPAIGGTRDLRELCADELAATAADVPLTVGDTAVFKHYLPRMLEIAVTGGFDWPDPEVVFGHLAFDDGARVVPWTRWPDAEQTALRSFMQALWRATIVAEDDGGDVVDTILCAIGQAETDLGWYLDEWVRCDHPTAASNLRRFLQLNARDLPGARLWNAFWEGDTPTERNAAAVVAWATRLV